MLNLLYLYQNSNIFVTDYEPDFYLEEIFDRFYIGLFISLFVDNQIYIRFSFC